MKRPGTTDLPERVKGSTESDASPAVDNASKKNFGARRSVRGIETKGECL